MRNLVRTFFVEVGTSSTNGEGCLSRRGSTLLDKKKLLRQRQVSKVENLCTLYAAKHIDKNGIPIAFA